MLTPPTLRATKWISSLFIFIASTYFFIFIIKVLYAKPEKPICMQMKSFRNWVTNDALFFFSYSCKIWPWYDYVSLKGNVLFETEKTILELGNFFLRQYFLRFAEMIYEISNESVRLSLKKSRIYRFIKASIIWPLLIATLRNVVADRRYRRRLGSLQIYTAVKRD